MPELSREQIEELLADKNTTMEWQVDALKMSLSSIKRAELLRECLSWFTVDEAYGETLTPPKDVLELADKIKANLEGE